MKKILAIAIVMIASINMIKAQGVCFGIKAGVNLENIIGLNSGQGVVGVTSNESAKMTVGYHAGAFVRIGLDDHWAIVPEGQITTGGAKKTVDQTYTLLGVTRTSSMSGTFSLTYIQIPIFVNYKFDNGLYLEAGPYAAFLVGASSSSTTTTSDGQSSSMSSSSDTSNNVLDLGVGAGVGYRFCMGLGFNLRYNYGLNAVYKEERSVNNAGIIYTQPSYGNNGVLQFSVSYLFGCGDCGPKVDKHVAEVTPIEPAKVAEVPPPPVEKDVQFSVQPPATVPGQHVVIETLPLRDYVFFDAGSTEIPSRYVILSKNDATSFTEEQLKDCQKNPGTRSSRQMKVYHNVLNIVADRMRNHPAATIKLVGSSGGKGVDIGRANANAVKNYLVNTFGIDGKRITIEGRNLPLVASEQPYNTAEIKLTNAEDNRVEILSTSPDLMMQVQGNSALCLKPIEVTAMDGSSADDVPIVVNVAGANDALESWSVDVTDSKGDVLNFGPFKSDQQNISAAAIMKDNQTDRYTIVLTGKTKTGHSITKQSSFELVRETPPTQKEQRASILFEFDKSKTVATYENFLTNTVAPLVHSNSVVIISGFTDVVGEEAYNLNLSKDRANETQAILERAVVKAGKTNIKYRTSGYGEIGTTYSNNLPEERFYNRTVIIDIIPSDIVVKGSN